MLTLETEFEIQKVKKIALEHGLNFHGQALSFNVLDEYLEYLDEISPLFATVKWDGRRWICRRMGLYYTSFSALETVFQKANSLYFWEE